MTEARGSEVRGVTINLAVEEAYDNWFRYNYIPYGILSNKEVEACLGDFVDKISNCLA